jgi:hypothetical protein
MLSLVLLLSSWARTLEPDFGMTFSVGMNPFQNSFWSYFALQEIRMCCG